MRVEDHIDRMLDAALEMTFPASDPIALYIAEPWNPVPRPDAERNPVQAAPTNG